jgi:hypothetical protein
MRALEFIEGCFIDRGEIDQGLVHADVNTRKDPNVDGITTKPVDDELSAMGYDPPERAPHVGRRNEGLRRGAEAGEPRLRLERQAGALVTRSVARMRAR